MLYKDTIESPAGNDAYWDPEAAAYYDPVEDVYFDYDEAYDPSHLFDEDVTEEELEEKIEKEIEKEIKADINSNKDEK